MPGSNCTKIPKSVILLILPLMTWPSVKRCAIDFQGLSASCLMLNDIRLLFLSTDTLYSSISWGYLKFLLRLLIRSVHETSEI